MKDEEVQDQQHFEGLVQGLIDNEYGCCNDFIKPSKVTGLRANIQSLNNVGKMKPFGFGNKSDNKQS
jgi:SM-20-related protein